MPKACNGLKAGRIYSNCHSVRVYPRKSCFSGEDWVSIWNQQINPRQVSERASLIGSSYWALNHDKMLLLFPCKLARNIWYFLHKSSIAVQEIYCSSYQNDDSLSVPIITCHRTWQQNVHACMHLKWPRCSTWEGEGEKGTNKPALFILHPLNNWNKQTVFIN